jgi:hypothetical protein
MPTPCGCGRGPIVAILTYLFPGATRRNNYKVCVHCYADYSREHLVQVTYLHD